MVVLLKLLLIVSKCSFLKAFKVVIHEQEMYLKD